MIQSLELFITYYLEILCQRYTYLSRDIMRHSSGKFHHRLCGLDRLALKTGYILTNKLCEIL